MENKIFFFIAIIFAVLDINAKPDVINNRKISDDIIQLYNTTHNLDSIINECIMEIIYSGEGSEWAKIRKVKLVINDTTAVIQSQDTRQIIDEFYSQVSLNKRTADYFKTLFFEIYSQHKSVIKDSVLNEDLSKLSHTSFWTIKLRFPNQEINESLGIDNYYYSFGEDPFYYQFEQILQLIFAIKRKMEYDIYSLKDPDYKMRDWIMENFNGVFYGTSDIIY